MEVFYSNKSNASSEIDYAILFLDVLIRARFILPVVALLGLLFNALTAFVALKMTPTETPHVILVAIAVVHSIDDVIAGTVLEPDLNYIL